jgi:serine/threonine protein kinase
MQRKLEPKDLPSVRRLGKGLSGFIYETTWGGNKYARKDFPLGSVKHVIFEKEVFALLDLDHPNIVKCFDYTVGRSTCSLLQEYMDDDLQNTMQRRIEALRKKNSTNSSRSRVLDADEMKHLLLTKIKGKDIRVDEGSSRLLGSGSTFPFEMPEAVNIISQIAIGMKYLQDNQVVHGDLKPKNVLVCSESGGLNVKVADFGLIETKKMIKLVSKRTQHYEILMWKAPELFEELLGPLTEDSDDPFTDSDTDEDVRIGSQGDDNFNFQSMADVYSFGLTCSQILGGKLLFPNLSLTELRQRRMHGFIPELPSACPEYLKFIISLCLQIEPLSRPTFSAICTLKALLSHIPELMDLMKGAISELRHSTFSCKMWRS